MCAGRSHSNNSSIESHESLTVCFYKKIFHQHQPCTPKKFAFNRLPTPSLLKHLQPNKQYPCSPSLTSKTFQICNNKDAIEMPITQTVNSMEYPALSLVLCFFGDLCRLSSVHSIILVCDRLCLWRGASLKKRWDICENFRGREETVD